jgi:ABC-type methionine transport system permease subunit
MYSMGINGYNPYTNWYGVYLVVIMYAILYENNIVDRYSFQSVLFSLINLVNSVPSILLVDSTYPFPRG